MKNKKKHFLNWRIFILTSAIALVSFGCGSATPTSVSKGGTITIWDPYEETNNLQPIFDAYRNKNPNVQINFIKKDPATYESDLLNALAAGKGPDIFSISNSWLPKYLDKTTPAPATVFNMRDYNSTFVNVMAQDFTKNNQVYGVAMSVDSLGLYYNKDLLGTAGIATPPKTWSEMAQDVVKLKKIDKTGYFTTSGVALGTSANINRAVDILYLFMLQQGVVPYASDLSTPTFDQSVQTSSGYSNPAEAALNFYTSFASPVSPNYNWNSRSDYSIDAFANGRLAFLYNYSYSRATILQKAPNLNFDVAPVPQPNINSPSVNFANYWGLVVSKQSKYSSTAWDLLKFMTSKNSLDQYYALNKVPSSRNDLISLQVSDPNIGVFADANLTAKDFYRPDQATMDNIFSNAIDSVVLKGSSVTDALSQASQQAAAITQ